MGGEGSSSAARQHPAEFVEVVAPAAPSPASAQLLELTLRNGLKLRFPVEIGPASLQRVLDTLEPR